MTKVDIVIKFMETHDYITQLDAYKLCCATRLGAMIFDLKQRGFDIVTTYVSTKHGRYAQYSFSNDYKAYRKYLQDNPDSEISYSEFLEKEIQDVQM